MLRNTLDKLEKQWDSYQEWCSVLGSFVVLLCAGVSGLFLGMTLLPCESLVPSFPQGAISECRSLPLAVVGTHLCQALRAGYAVSLERAGLTPAVQRILRDVICSPPINSGKHH